MLDSFLIQFVEPIGPGQIVDRESLVALPVGFLQLSIENKQDEVIVKILGVKDVSEYDECICESDIIIKTYVWQRGMVVAGEEIMDISEGTNLNRRTTNKMISTRRRSRKQQIQSSFRFLKNPATAINEGVDGVLQLCVYQSQPSKMQRKRFLGTVHISLKCLTSVTKNSKEIIVGAHDWFKIFPKSTFLPGCPSDIAKTKCYICGNKEQDDDIRNDVITDEEVVSTSSYQASTSSYQNCVTTDSNSLSFGVFDTSQNRRRSTKFNSTRSLQRSNSTQHRELSHMRGSIKKTLFGLFKKSINEEDSDNSSNKRSIRLAQPVTPPALSSSAPPLSAPFLVGSPSSVSTKTSLFGSLDSHSGNLRLYSNSSSSTDIGYESSRSEYSVSDEDDVRTVRKIEHSKTKFRISFSKRLDKTKLSKVKSLSPDVPRSYRARRQLSSSQCRPLCPNISHGTLSKQSSVYSDISSASDISSCSNFVQQKNAGTIEENDQINT